MLFGWKGEAWGWRSKEVQTFCEICLEMNSRWCYWDIEANRSEASEVFESDSKDSNNPWAPILDELEAGFKSSAGPSTAWSSTLTSDKAKGSNEQEGDSSRTQSASIQGHPFTARAGGLHRAWPVGFKECHILVTEWGLHSPPLHSRYSDPAPPLYIVS